MIVTITTVVYVPTWFTYIITVVMMVAIERAVYCLECNFHPLFNYTQANCRLDYSQQENRYVHWIKPYYKAPKYEREIFNIINNFSIIKTMWLEFITIHVVLCTQTAFLFDMVSYFLNTISKKKATWLHNWMTWLMLNCTQVIVYYFIQTFKLCGQPRWVLCCSPFSCVF